MGWLKYEGNRLGTIYGLTDPRTGELRYVGKTTGDAQRRCQAHIRETRKKPATAHNHRRAWIRQLLTVGLRPSAVVLDQGVWSNDELNQREIYWIACYRDLGCPLTNATFGGDGGANEGFLAAARVMWTPEKKQEHSELMRTWAEKHKASGGSFRGDDISQAVRSLKHAEWMNREGREVLSAANKEAWKRARLDPDSPLMKAAADSERRRKIGEASKKRYLDPQERRKLGEAVARGLTDEGKKRIGDSSRLRHGYDHPIEEVPCASCGSHFLPRRRSKRTCSTECWRALAAVKRSETWARKRADRNGEADGTESSRTSGSAFPR